MTGLTGALRMVGGRKSKTALQVIYAISVLVVAVVAYTLVERRSARNRNDLDEGGRIWTRAQCVAFGVRDLDVPGLEGPLGGLVRATARKLLNLTMDLAHDLGQWQNQIDEETVRTGELFSSLTDLAGSLAMFEDMLEQVDTRISALEEARATALDAIRIILYNLVQRDAPGGTDALRAAVDLMRAVMEQRRVPVELPLELSDRYPIEQVCDSLAVLAEAIEEIEESRGTANALLGAAKERADRVERTASELSESLVAATENPMIELVVIAVAALALWLAGIMALGRLGVTRRRPKREGARSRKVRHRDRDTTR